MAHAQSNRMQHSDAGLSCLLRLLRLLCLFCLLAWLTACTVQDGVAYRLDADSAGLAPEAPPAEVAQPSTIKPSSGAWSGIGGLLGNLTGGIGSGGTLASGNATAPAGAMHVTVYYATDRQYQARSHNYGCGLVLRLFGLTGRIDVLEGGDWSIGTYLTQGGEPINYGMSKEGLRRLLLGFPLTLAFLSAPPRPVRPWRAAAISIPVLCLVFAVCVGLVVWGELAPMLAPDLAGAAMTVTTRPDQPPLPGFVSQIVIVGRAIALSVATLITALILWAALNPAGMKTLVAEIKD